jgi:biotin-dependent carboxylase-like uncharacterized protein
MTQDVLKVISPGLGATIQDRGRFGWGRFGVPASGVMDTHAADWANQLLNNPPDAPVLELLLQGAALAAVKDCWLAITGADAGANQPLWRAVKINIGETIHFPRNRSGVWTYIAVEGGFDSEEIFGSASVYPRGGIGKPLAAGDVLRSKANQPLHWPSSVAGRFVPEQERRDYDRPPSLKVWPGPQWKSFSEKERNRFFAGEWTLSSKSDRVGYRLIGEPLSRTSTQILSEAVRAGTIQVPEDGLPIVTMRDGPTVGGYPKLGLVDAADLSWLTQCRAGQKMRFQQHQHI